MGKTVQVKLEVAKAYELDPEKSYLVEVPEASYTKEAAYDLAKQLSEMNVRGLVAVRRGGDMIEIKELPMQSAKKAAFPTEVDQQKPSK